MRWHSCRRELALEATRVSSKMKCSGWMFLKYLWYLMVLVVKHEALYDTSYARSKKNTHIFAYAYKESRPLLSSGISLGFLPPKISEVASMASAAVELISAKMKRAATRDSALKTVRALSWNPPATLPALPALLWPGPSREVEVTPSSEVRKQSRENSW